MNNVDVGFCFALVAGFAARSLQSPDLYTMSTYKGQELNTD